jgi:uncharacterized membrane protein
MLRFAFLIFCVASWYIGFYQLLLAINLLLAGAVLFGLYREREQARAMRSENLPRDVRPQDVWNRRGALDTEPFANNVRDQAGLVGGDATGDDHFKQGVAERDRAIV